MNAFCSIKTKHGRAVILFLLCVFAGGNVEAACSAYQGKVVLNEYNYIDNWIELKVLDSSVIGATTQFAGWKLWVFKQSKPGSPASQNVGSMYTNIADNSCGTASAQYYIRIPFPAVDMDNDVNVVLADASNNIVDVLRIDQTALASYYSGFNACAVTFNNMTDAPLLGSAGNKDIARLPDGTGAWVISNGTGSNSQQSLCTSNDALFALTKTPSSPVVGIGSASPFTWSVNVKNGGSIGNLSSTTVSDTMPANMFLSICPTGAACTGTAGAYTGFSKNVGTLAPGVSATISATAYVTAAGTYTNSALATATELAPGYTQGSGTVIASTCTPPANIPAGVSVTCQCDNFSRAALNPSTIFGANWLVSASDASGIVPSIVNPGYLRLTNNSGNNAKAATVPGIFPASGNYISVEFRQYAYSGTGADGIAVTLSDYAVPAVPGAFGGSLGYAQRTGVAGFAGGWLGVAMDEFGNYQNPTEGRLGGPGFVVDSVGARGSGSGMSGYRWLAGTSSLAPPIDNRTSTTPAPGYFYQVIVDARNEPASTAIAVNRNTGTGYASLINIPDVYAAATALGFTQAPVPNNWQISFTGSTGGSTNIHEIGDLRICASSFLPPGGGTASGFSAIDEVYPPAANAIPAYQNFQTGHIYMKLPGAANAFKLWVAALTNTGISSSYSTAGAKYAQVKLVDNSDNACGLDAARTCNSSCTNKAAVEAGATQRVTFASGGAGASLSPSFTLNSSWKSLVAVIKECTTSACSAFTATAPACSVDSLSVRPLSIASVTSSNASNTTTSGTPFFKAGSDNFSLTATTTGVAGSPSGYTGNMELMNTSVLAASPATVAGVVAGSFPAATSATPSSTATGNAFTYSEVGAFTLAGFTPDAACSLSGAPLAAAQCNALPRGAYDRSWTQVDGISTKGDCVMANYSNVRDMSGSFATNSNYGKYGCNFGLLPNTVVFGRFVPDHFDTLVTGWMSCPSGMTCPCPSVPTGSACPPDPANGFVYSGQPFTSQLTARNAAGAVTLNYDSAKTLSRAVTLSAWNAAGADPLVAANANPGGGVLSANSILSTAFTAGVATSIFTPAYTFAAAPTLPADIYIRATDADSVSSLRATASASIEGGVKVVSGRITIPNAYGSELLPLSLTATVQIYNAAGSWVPSNSDAATTISASDFGLLFPAVTANKLAACETALSVTGSSPNFILNLLKPGSGNNGWTDLTLNLGAIAAGNRCTVVGGMGAASTTANRPWLQYPAGSNPTARATFGVYKGSNNFIYQRESY